MNISAILSCFAWCNSHINALLLDAADRNLDLRKIFLQLHSTDSVVCKNWIGFLSWWIKTCFCKVATSWLSSIVTNIFRFVFWKPCECLDCQTCQNMANSHVNSFLYHHCTNDEKCEDTFLFLWNPFPDYHRWALEKWLMHILRHHWKRSLVDLDIW